MRQDELLSFLTVFNGLSNLILYLPKISTIIDLRVILKVSYEPNINKDTEIISYLSGKCVINTN